MFESRTIAILVLLVAAWGFQIWLSNQQMRRFHGRSQKLRRLGKYMAIGLAGNTYRRKTYAVLVIDDEHRVVAAEYLSGFTIFASLRPIEGVTGMDLDRVGEGHPPPGVSVKTWDALEHAAGFIRNQLAKEEAAGERAAGDIEGGAMG